MTQTSSRPPSSDMYAIERPSGEKAGLTLIAAPRVSLLGRPPSEATSQTSTLPSREEKNAIRRPSGEGTGWKSPPGPRVRGWAEPDSREWTQTFISPDRSELKKIDFPSADQAPRLSSRVVAVTLPGSPPGRPASG